MEISKDIGIKLFTTITTWKYIKTPKQIEDECGAITFLHIKDIINNYKDADMDFSQYTDKFKNMRKELIFYQRSSFPSL